MYEQAVVKRGYSVLAELWPIARPHGAFIAGGFARWMLSNADIPVPAGDVDLFVPSGDPCGLVEDLQRRGYVMRTETDNAYTFEPRNDLFNVQVIKPDWTRPTVEATLDAFDFTVVQAAVLFPARGVVSEQFHADEQRRALRLVTINDPVRTLLRMVKYARRGYTLLPSSAAEFVSQLTIDYDGVEYWDDLDTDWYEREGEEW